MVNAFSKMLRQFRKEGLCYNIRTYLFVFKEKSKNVCLVASVIIVAIQESCLDSRQFLYINFLLKFPAM